VNSKQTNPPQKGVPGRKPLGKRAMTNAERLRRSRRLLAEQGGHAFAIRVQGAHWTEVQWFAAATGQTPTEVVRQIVQDALDRFVLVPREAQAMLKRGASLEDAAQYIDDNLDTPFHGLTRIRRKLTTDTP